MEDHRAAVSSLGDATDIISMWTAGRAREHATFKVAIDGRTHNVCPIFTITVEGIVICFTRSCLDMKAVFFEPADSREGWAAGFWQCVVELGVNDRIRLGCDPVSLGRQLRQRGVAYRNDHLIMI